MGSRTKQDHGVRGDHLCPGAVWLRVCSVSQACAETPETPEKQRSSREFSFLVSAFGLARAYCDLPGTMTPFCVIDTSSMVVDKAEPRYWCDEPKLGVNYSAQGPCASQLLGAERENGGLARPVPLFIGGGATVACVFVLFLTCSIGQKVPCSAKRLACAPSGSEAV
ncbi:hypothetical protein B0I37DRAFT_353613 [Chaetomium sp. MPI-CAGE-AT-0009]|nr:hypothetical protein B0I37DRAFT_353613 [Chaetomium sp. MPI-CAGE-AT-0009]